LIEKTGLEVELKLEFRPEDAARLGRVKSLPQARLGVPKAEQIVTVYFDTQDLALRKAGLSLRMRHAGAKRLQTVKSERLEDLPGGPRAEDEVPVNGVGPDVKRIADPMLRERVLSATAKQALAPQFETVVLRTTRHVRTKLGDVVEFVVDLGEVRAAKEDWPICELELELKEGSPQALFDLARALNEEVPLRLVRLSKADRGYALLGETVGAPKKSRPVGLKPEASTGEAFQLILENCLSHLLANEPAVVERQDVEGLHQLRVAMRRLRAAVSTFEPLLAEGLARELGHEIKGIGAICGAARDYDVFLATVLPAAAEAMSAVKGGSAALEQAARAARADAWAKVVEAVASSRFTALMIEVGSLAAEEKLPTSKAVRRRDWEAPARGFAGDALDRHRRKVVKRASALLGHSDEERHELRKRLKRLRYAGEFFAGLYREDEAKGYLKRIGALQDCFGALNDAATAERLVGSLCPFGAGEKAALIAAAGAKLIGFHRQAAEALMEEAQARWEKLAKRKPYWRAS
jgi:inorganic triphosphatase YgiF